MSRQFYIKLSRHLADEQYAASVLCFLDSLPEQGERLEVAVNLLENYLNQDSEAIEKLPLTLPGVHEIQAVCLGMRVAEVYGYPYLRQQAVAVGDAVQNNLTPLISIRARSLLERIRAVLNDRPYLPEVFESCSRWVMN